MEQRICLTQEELEVYFKGQQEIGSFTPEIHQMMKHFGKCEECTKRYIELCRESKKKTQSTVP